MICAPGATPAMPRPLPLVAAMMLATLVPWLLNDGAHSWLLPAAVFQPLQSSG